MIYVRSGIQEALWGKVRLAEEKINECGVKLNVAKREKEEVERIVREKKEDRRNAIGKNQKKRKLKDVTEAKEKLKEAAKAVTEAEWEKLRDEAQARKVADALKVTVQHIQSLDDRPIFEIMLTTTQHLNIILTFDER